MSLTEVINKAKTITEALPYIRRFRGQYVLIKFGGSLMVDPALQATFAKDVALLKWIGVHPVIVHGGGKEITHWLKRIGKETRFIEGLRYTDEETMELSEMVLSGKINSELVSLINSSGAKAVGLSGKDARLVIAKKAKSKSGEDLGLVGEVVEVDVELLLKLSEQGYVPVVSSVSGGVDGGTFNLNADAMASALAGALKSLKLVFLTDVDGLKVEGSLVQSLTLSEAEKLLKHPDVQGGMLPKLECAISALRGGVKSVHIINGGLEHTVLLEMFTDVGIGTMLSA